MSGAAEVRSFQVQCLPGTDPFAPQIVDLVMPVRTVLGIRVRIPPGPLSSMGFQIGSNGVPIIPYNDDTFVVADDETFEWTVPGQINSGSWQAIMYNQGYYPHTIYIYFTVQLPDLPPAAPLSAPLPAESLGPSALAPLVVTDLSGALTGSV